MDLKRFWHSLRLYTMFSSRRRGDYVRRHGLFGGCGENVRLPQMLLPLHAEQIFVGNNVEIASGVEFAAHDAIHSVLNGKYGTDRFPERLGPIAIGDNVFIGARTVLLGGVTVGSDVVIGACSLVNRDLPSGGVYAGAPARRIGSFEALAKKREPAGDGA